MCWIAKINKGNKLPWDYIEQAQTKNKDGYGVSWYSKGKIKTYKTLDFEEFNQKLEQIEGNQMIIHLRNATVGTSDCATNVHPFTVPTGVMFHNGTISTLRDHKAATSDTSRLAAAISKCNFSQVSDVEPLLQVITGSTINRLVFLNNDGTIDIVNKHLGIDDDNGNWYSNEYHIKPQMTKVFVYGTLKSGLTNHYRYLYGSDLVSVAETVDKWAMIGKNMGFPYLLQQDESGHNVTGEVYEVDADTLGLLDILEGVPYHYQRKAIKVKLNSTGKTETVLAYIKTNVTDADLAKPFIKTFQGRTYTTLGDYYDKF